MPSVGFMVGGRSSKSLPGFLHLVTKSCSKALIPWAAFSRVSSLAGGPCQSVQCYNMTHQPHVPSRVPTETQNLPSSLLRCCPHVGPGPRLLYHELLRVKTLDMTHPVEGSGQRPQEDAGTQGHQQSQMYTTDLLNAVTLKGNKTWRADVQLEALPLKG